MDYTYVDFVGYCVMLPITKWHLRGIYTSFIMLLLFLPLVVVIISCIISVVQLRKSLTLTEGNSAVTISKRNATITSLIVTFVYITLNIPLAILCILQEIIYPDITNLLPFSVYHYVSTFLDVGCVSLNATINPIVYFFRMTTFNLYVRDTVISMRRKVALMLYTITRNLN